MSDAERAIELLEENQKYMKGDANEYAYALALSALKKNQKAIEYCNDILSIKSVNDFERVLDIACQKVLEILEGE